MAKKPTKADGKKAVKAAPKAKAAKPAKSAAKPAKIKEVEISEVIQAAPPVEVTPPVAAKKAEKPPKAPRVKKISAEQLQAQADASKKWIELKEKFSGEKAVSYNMSASFDANTPIQHKTFGWGFIVNNDNNRLEVLFESGTKHLISNYKS
jgi:hypothetical protein